MKPTFNTLKISEIRKETEETVSIQFEIPEELKSDYQFVSGQYLTLKTDVDGEEIRRSYSLCSAPYENEWRVAVKQVESGKFSTYANTELKAGMKLDVMTPTGNFQLKPDNSQSKNYLLIAAGSGVTPIISIAKTILREEPDSYVTFFFGNKGFHSIIFREAIEGLKNKYIDRLRIIHVLSRESLGTPILKGRIDAEKCTQLVKAFMPNEKIDEAFICGPEEMILGAKESLSNFGMNAENIHFELFGTGNTGNKKREINPQLDANVSIILDGDTLEIELDSNGENILDAAQKAGADLPFACKGGVCCTCKAKILEGTASMDVNYALEPDEVEAGYVLTCQAHPTSDKLVVSFDD